MTTSPSAAVSAGPISVVVRSVHAMAEGDRADFDPLYHPRAVDRENRIQPPSSRVHGAACFYSTALWLRAAFEGMHYDVHHAVADGHLVVVNCTMNGRHTAPWTVYAEDGSVDNVFPPTGRTFAMTQSHWFRLEDGQIIEHWANRDDLGMARQLGWIPPSPAFLFKMARAPSAAPASQPDPPDPLTPSRAPTPVLLCSQAPDAMEPGIQCVRTRWNRGFMTFQLARRTRTVMLTVPMDGGAGTLTPLL